MAELTKQYGEVAAVAGIDLEVAAGRVLHDARALRLGQDDDAADDRRLRGPDRRHDRAGRRGRQRRAALRPRGQHRLPGLRALPAHDRRRERRLRPAGREGVAKDERAKRRDEALEMVRLPGYGDRKPGELSGGQRQRVALARAIVNRPRVLLLDEPLGALDLKLREQMQVELKSIQSEVGITFVYVTHDQDEALTMSDRIAVFNDGRIEQVGPPFELYEQPATEFVAGFVGVSNVLERDGSRFTIRPEKVQLLERARRPRACAPSRDRSPTSPTRGW